MSSDKWIVAEGDASKVEKTERHFTELRASLKNGPRPTTWQKLKSIDYYPDGSIKKVEYYE